MLVINSSFIGNFNLGDNICFNLSILRTLYAYRGDGNPQQKRYLQKPIILLNVSIIEAVLYDFHRRIQTFTREGIANLPAQVAEYVRLKKIDELEKYIKSAKKHDFFDLKDTGFYESLDELRKIRNRVHIQNTKRYFEANDHAAFSERRLILSEQALEMVMGTMAKKYSRPHKYVADFALPWDPHFPNEWK